MLRRDFAPPSSLNLVLLPDSESVGLKIVRMWKSYDMVRSCYKHVANHSVADHRCSMYYG